MRLVLAVLAFALMPFAADAQVNAPSGYRGPDLAAQRAAMDRLSGLVGDWQGEAQVTSPRAMTVHQSERVERDLGGLILRVRGMGHATAERTGETIFDAFAVISFNERENRYDFRTYAHGYSTNATAQFLPDGSFQWTTPPGPVQSRYTIQFDATTWREIGEMSRDGGTTWTRTVELNLRRAN